MPPKSAAAESLAPKRAAAYPQTIATAVTAVTAAPGGATTSVGRIYLATVAWALGGIIAGQGRRNPGVATSAALGLIQVLVTLVHGFRTPSRQLR